MEQSGKIFRIEREKRKLSIQEVSKTLKIREHIIEAIEAGEVNILPPVYMKAFIKDYSNFLKIDNDYVTELLSHLTPKDDIQKLAEESEKTVKSKPVDGKRYEEIFAENKIKKQFFNKNHIVNYLIYTALVLILIATVYFAFFDYSNNDKRNQTFAPSQSDTLDLTASNKNDLNSTYNPTDSMKLSIEASDSVWVRVSMDGKRTIQQVFIPGKEIQMKAWDYFQLTCDDASAIKVKRNDEALPQLSSQGKVIRNVKITRNEIINPTAFSRDTTTSYQRKKKVQKKEEEKPKFVPIAPSRVPGVKPNNH